MIKDALIISNRNKVCNIPFTEIVYLMSNGMCTTVHVIRGETHFCSKNLGSIEKDLNRSDFFFRVHTSYIVCISKIKEYQKKEGKIIMTCGTMIPVAKRRKSKFLKVYFK